MHLASLRSRKRTRSLPRSCCPAHQRPADRSPSRVWLVLACLGSALPGLGGFACRTGALLGSVCQESWRKRALTARVRTPNLPPRPPLNPPPATPPAPPPPLA